jgi:hypothetical protein
VFRAAGETETMQEIIQDWLQLDDGDIGFHLLTHEEIAAVIYISSISISYIIKFSIYLFPQLFCLFGLFFTSLIRKTSPPQLIRISEASLYILQRQTGT